MKVTVYTFPWVVAPLSLKWWSTLDIRRPVVPLRLFHRSFIIHKPSSASEWMPLRHLSLPHFFLPLSHQWFSRAWINSKGAQLTSSDIFFWCLLGKNPKEEGRKKSIFYLNKIAIIRHVDCQLQGCTTGCGLPDCMQVSDKSIFQSFDSHQGWLHWFAAFFFFSQRVGLQELTACTILQKQSL